MDGKAVNIYAYREGFSGVFFYNGNMSTRDPINDVLHIDGNESTSPIYDGYKITEIDGITGEEAEVFTSPKGYGNGVLITGERVKEQYIDIVAVGAGDMEPEEYYQNARAFHIPGSWYILNIQYLGTWHRVRAILTNVKITPGNVYNRQEVVVSYLIPDVRDAEYYDDSIPIEALPTRDVYIPENVTYTDVIEVPFEKAGWPAIKFKMTANPELYEKIEHDVSLELTGFYKDPQTGEEGSVRLDTRIWPTFLRTTEKDGNIILASVCDKLQDLTQKKQFVSDGSYATYMWNTRPSRFREGWDYRVFSITLDDFVSAGPEFRTGSMSTWPEGAKLTRFEFKIEHTEAIHLEVTWQEGV